MRLSAKAGHEDYKDDFYRYKVLLDGEEINGCFFADEEEGYIEAYIFDTHGVYIKDADGGLYVMTTYGKVEIVKNPD